MNIYQKLNEVRVALQSMNLKHSGKNTYAGYTYYELGDFLPHVNRLFKEHGLFSQVNFTADEATLTILDVDKPEDKVVFTSPMSSAQLKGCHEVQNLGAVQTYLRRYLYTAALEIVEHDALDATTRKDDTERASQATPRATRQTAKQATRGASAKASAAATKGAAGAANDPVVKALREYHAKAEPLLPNPQERTDFLRYCSLVMDISKNGTGTLVQSTMDLSPDRIETVTRNLDGKDGDALRALLAEWKMQYAQETAAAPAA